MSIENLSSWVNIGKGTADYIIQYVDEDMALVIDDKFVMELDHQQTLILAIDVAKIHRQS